MPKHVPSKLYNNVTQNLVVIDGLHLCTLITCKIILLKLHAFAYLPSSIQQLSYLLYSNISFLFLIFHYWNICNYLFIIIII
jgi:hypothetical protein